MNNNTNALHAHKWGQPWIDNLGIFELNKTQHKLLFEACEKIDISILLSNSEFMNIINAVDQFIKNNGPVFYSNQINKTSYNIF